MDTHQQIATLTVLKAMTQRSCGVTSMEIPSSDAITSWSKKTAVFGVAPLIPQPSLSVVNKLLHLESVTSGMSQIT